MQINTIRFGEVQIDEKKILTFNEGLPGLEEHKRYAVLQFEESNPIYWLHSVEDPAICLPVSDAFTLLPEYAFNIGDDDVNELELQGPEDLHVMCVLVIPDNIEEMTANLAAPVIVNLRTGKARQIILASGSYSVRYPVFAEVCRLIKEGDADAGSVKKD